MNNNEMSLILPDVNTNGSLPTMQLPDVDSYNYWNFYNHRILTIDGDITEWDYNIVKSIITINIIDKDIPVEERTPIIILINSNGGYLDVTNSIIDAIAMSNTPVWTVNMGSALSGGCIVFLAGEKRFTTANSWLMAHKGSGEIQGNYSETKEQSKVWDAQIKNMGDFILSRTGLDKKIWQRNKNKDWYLNCNQQIEYGFATDKLENINQLWERG